MSRALTDLGIHKVIIEGNDIIICLERPGLLIGVKGSNINALQAYLDKQDVTGKIQIFEVTRPATDYLMNWTYGYMDLDFL